MDEAQFKARIEQIFADLDRYSYYELLNLTADAPPDTIRAAFHRMALSMHPDRFHGHEDLELREKVYVIYKRMTEGYRTLMDSASRKEYDQAVAAGQLRLEKTDRRKPTLKRTEDAIEHPKARKFFQLAEEAERRGDLKGAMINYKFAKNLIGDHPLIDARIAKIEEKQRGT